MAKRSHAKRKKKAAPKKPARKKLRGLNFINNSNDANNSKIVIFQDDGTPPKASPSKRGPKSKSQPGRGAR